MEGEIGMKHRVVRPNITVSEVHWKMLKELAQKMGIKRSDAIRRAIEIYHRQEIQTGH
jgi:NADH dehydrogenase/NADH:ubiquinone oxidoreductase subunit G